MEKGELVVYRLAMYRYTHHDRWGRKEHEWSVLINQNGLRVFYGGVADGGQGVFSHSKCVTVVTVLAVGRLEYITSQRLVRWCRS